MPTGRKRSGYTKRRDKRLAARTLRRSSSLSSKSRSNRSSANFRSVSSSSAKRGIIGTALPWKKMHMHMHMQEEPNMEQILKRHHTV